MRGRTILLVSTFLILTTPRAALAGDGNRLAYLEGSDPYYVGLNFPKLTTPQWVGEDGVEAVVVLAIDDMRDNVPKYEAFLRPILNRLKAIDGRAPVSIMTCRVDPNAPELQKWFEEGVNIDVHTLAHPCPLLQKGDFNAAKQTVLDCIDLLSKIPNNRPVAFRMPCCDSLNTPSPRFFAEIFNTRSPDNHFLSIDSSVFNILTPDDPSLPRNLVIDPDGRERFRKYLPFPSFVNTIENYPYPYVIGRLCWEFPCVVPSDWEAQHLLQPKHPRTALDMKAALDAVVRKQGVFNLVFHPHGWIESDQVVALIDHAVAAHGRKVMFLNFREAQERLDKNLLGGQPLRTATGQDNGVRLLDLNNDGYLDVIIGHEQKRETRLWEPSARRWTVAGLPTALVTREVQGRNQDLGVRFGLVHPDGRPSMLVRNGSLEGAWHFDGSAWRDDRSLLSGLASAPRGRSARKSEVGRASGIRFRDIDGDGCCELIVGNDASDGRPRGLDAGDAASPWILAWSEKKSMWERLPFTLPELAIPFVTLQDRENGVRFVDLDEDGRDDIVVSREGVNAGTGIFLFDSMEKGWSREVKGGGSEDPRRIPPIAITRADGTSENNGFWAHSRHLWWRNETTAKLPDLVDRRSFNDLLKDVEPRGKSPEASSSSIRVRPGFKVELVAAEPLVEDPIAFDWSPDGKLWVVEMGDYPLGTDGKGKFGGVVRCLEDINGDGRYDKSTLFLEGLGFPSGILCWRKGVLIACAPDIFYAEDRDGDGKADVREVLFTGFHEGNQQHRLNGFEYGLDGWVYGANGDSGGRVRSIKTGQVVDIRGRDFRFRPEDGRFEAESGQTQYGRHRDDRGNWFGDNNPNWLWHYVLSDRDLRRNTSFAAPDPRQMIEPERNLFPVSRTLARFNDFDNVNRVTSANSPAPYRDDLFGAGFENSVFVSEPVHNLVHRVVLERDGATFLGHRAVGETDREFLASSDNWFRPTMLKTGPDGALWISDMYRAVIEHPEWIPDDWESKLDLRAGHDQGRIYRVYPVDQRPRPIPRLDERDTAGLVTALGSSNGWVRDTAQRLLTDSGDRAAIEPLQTLAATHARATTRVQALWTLEGLNGLATKSILTALSDRDPEVRRHALAAGIGLAKDHAEVGEAVVALIDDPDERVRLQLSLSLGDWNDPKAARTLARLILRDTGDRWFRAAVSSSASPHSVEILTELFAQTKMEPATAYLEPLYAFAGRRQGQLPHLIRMLGEPRNGQFAPWQIAALAGLLDATDRTRATLTQSAEADPELRGALDRLDAMATTVRTLVADEKAPLDRRLMAVRLLGRDRGGAGAGADIDLLERLLRPQEPASLQLAAVSVLGKLTDPRVPKALLSGWKGHSPAARSAILDTLSSRAAWVSELLGALEGGQVAVAEIDSARRARLLEHREAAIRDRAAMLFSKDTGTREAVIASYRPALQMSGDATAGAAVFKRACASCHRLDGEGIEVGPDLATLTDKSPEALLAAVLDPNRAFEAKYTNFTVQTTDGRILTGLIAAETSTSVTLQRQEGKQDVLLRSDIEELAGSNQSLMPEGLEKDLSLRDVSDLIAYLANRPRPQAENARADAPRATQSAGPQGREPLFDGLGPRSRPVTNASVEAQRYFDQGLKFLYAFNHDEAIRSFRQAATLDPSCAMAWWGIAYACGPHINNPTVDEAHAREGSEALAKARECAPGASPVERSLIDALTKRYADPQPSDRKPLDQAFADAMRSVWKQNPGDSDVGAIYAEALMNLRPWDLWTHDGQPQPNTDEIIHVLEAVLSREPDHPLALHLTIHAQEASPHPEKAERAADRLRDLSPGLAHLDHMPSHIDVRLGRWKQAERSNEKAIAADEAYRKIRPNQGFYRLYMLHNRHMLAFAALMRGESKRATRAIDEMIASVPPEWALQNATIADGALAMPLELRMRFGRWDEILAAPEPDAIFPAARAFRHAVRVTALAATGKVAEAHTELAAFLEAKQRVPDSTLIVINKAVDVLGVAELLITGELLYREGKPNEAFIALREAVRLEDALRYSEPPDWILPVRHVLGAALMQSGRYSEAERVYRDDLARHPENGWSLFGLARSLELQEKVVDAAKVRKRFEAAWTDADVQLVSSCFCQPGV